MENESFNFMEYKFSTIIYNSGFLSKFPSCEIVVSLDDIVLLNSPKMSDSEIDTIDNLDYEHVGRRALHNAQERKRRNHIKENFNNLRDSVPTIQGEKSVSRAQILKKAGDYILYMKRRNLSHQQDIDDLKRQNTILEQQIKSIEKSLNLGQRDMYSNSDSSDLEEDFSV
ncbi:hypothetical protein GE061_015922 [Apolygus lucorum]|uniref:BHLH domain-containing protein n=2 Tax=Mirini TaxID=236659 RepID=A0A8S9XHE0_APOLU|nr:hypothetical protein GE061_015922 [Apolygus lucorum]